MDKSDTANNLINLDEALDTDILTGKKRRRQKGVEKKRPALAQNGGLGKRNLKGVREVVAKAGLLSRQRRPITLKSGLVEGRKAGSAGRKKSISAKGTRTRAATSATARKRVSLKATVRPLTAADNAPVSVASPQKRIPGIRSQGDGGGASGNGAVYRNVPKVNAPPDTNPSPTQVSGEVGRARWVDHVKARRQVLIVVGLSFAAGILFHALLEPDPPPQPVPVTADREQAGIRGGGQRETGVDQSVPSLEPQWSGYGVQPAPSTGYFPAPQPSPTDNGYTPGTPGFRSYSGQGGDATWPREGSPRQYPIKRWDEQTPDQGWVSPRENRNRDRTEQHTFGGSLGEERYPYSRPW